MADLLLEFIDDNGISLKDLRGQFYGNASNMSGKYKGMQSIIKERNHQAEYIPCVAPSLNLVRTCAAECCRSAVRFFMFVQGLYVFFSASTHRWNLLTNALKPLQCPTTKPLSDARWLARYDALHALRKSYRAVLQVLEVMCDDQGRSEKKIERGPNFATFSVTSFTYNGILPFVNYARRYYKNSCTKLRKCECDFTDQM